MHGPTCEAPRAPACGHGSSHPGGGLRTSLQPLLTFGAAGGEARLRCAHTPGPQMLCDVISVWDFKLLNSTENEHTASVSRSCVTFGKLTSPGPFLPDLTRLQGIL